MEQHRREVLPIIPGANIEVIGDSGHLLPIDQPHKLAEAIRAFVLSVTKVGESQGCIPCVLSSHVLEGEDQDKI